VRYAWIPDAAISALTLSNMCADGARTLAMDCPDRAAAAARFKMMIFRCAKRAAFDLRAVADLVA
jgi:hypothetical protein